MQQLPACQQLVCGGNRSTYIHSCTNITLLQDEEMSWLDKSCLHLAVKKKDKIETVTFQVSQTQRVENTTRWAGGKTWNALNIVSHSMSCLRKLL